MRRVLAGTQTNHADDWYQLIMETSGAMDMVNNVVKWVVEGVCPAQAQLGENGQSQRQRSRADCQGTFTVHGCTPTHRRLVAGTQKE